jgi:hypothetical protein
VTLMKRTPFTFVTVPTNGTVAQLAAISFTSPLSGTARLAGRGYCNINFTSGLANNVIMASGTVLANVFSTSVSDWGVLSVPTTSPSGNYQLDWSSDSVMSVTAGAPTTVFLGVKHEVGTSPANCSGTFEVEIFVGNLP